MAFHWRYNQGDFILANLPVSQQRAGYASAVLDGDNVFKPSMLSSITTVV